MSSNRTQEAYEYLRGKLLRGELQRGTRLSTLALAKELAFSNMPVREALNKLHAEGLVERKPNAGCVVRSMDEQEIEELYVLREMLECFAAEACARHISHQDLGTLEDICVEMRQVANEARTVSSDVHQQLNYRISNTDLRFHEMLIRASGNRWVAKTASTVVPLSQMMHAQRFPPGSQLRWASARNYRIHSSILKVIRSGDVTAAGQIMRAHVRCGNPLYEVKRLSFPGGMKASLK